MNPYAVPADKDGPAAVPPTTPSIVNAWRSVFGARPGVIPALHESRVVLGWLEHALGRLVATLCFTGLLALCGTPHVLVVGAALAVIALFPAWRRAICMGAGGWWLLRYHEWLGLHVIDDIAWREGADVLATIQQVGVRVGMLAATIALTGVSIAALRRWAPSGTRNVPPHWWLIGGQSALIVVVALLPVSGTWRVTLWGLTWLLGKYTVHAAYSLYDPPTDPGYRGWRQAIAWYPFWFRDFGQNHTPIPKGAAFLSRIEARTDADFAMSQARGLRLGLWGAVLSLPVVQGIGPWIQASGGMELTEAFAQVASGHALPWHVAWTALAGSFLGEILRVVAIGHLVIATARMAGFYAPRNTYRLLTAETVADFWNRFLYYYKEVLVDLFFMPTYRRYFKGNPELRLIVATMAAAGVGNFFVHFVYDALGDIASHGWRYTLGFWTVFAVYTVLLAGGIVVSQMRTRRRRSDTPRPWYRRVVSIAGVWLFFCVIRVFGAIESADLAAHFRYLRALLPV